MTSTPPENDNRWGDKKRYSWNEHQLSGDAALNAAVCLNRLLRGVMSLFDYAVHPENIHTSRWKRAAIHIFFSGLKLKINPAREIQTAQFTGQSTQTCTLRFYITRPSGKMFPSHTFLSYCFALCCFLHIFRAEGCRHPSLSPPHLSLSLSPSHAALFLASPTRSVAHTVILTPRSPTPPLSRSLALSHTHYLSLSFALRMSVWIKVVVDEARLRQAG